MEGSSVVAGAPFWQLAIFLHPGRCPHLSVPFLSWSAKRSQEHSLTGRCRSMCELCQDCAWIHVECTEPCLEPSELSINVHHDGCRGPCSVQSERLCRHLPLPNTRALLSGITSPYKNILQHPLEVSGPLKRSRARTDVWEPPDGRVSAWP